MRRLLAVLLLALVPAGCSLVPDWLGEPEAPPLPGKRIAVLARESAPKPDPSLATIEVRLPPPRVNAAWPQAEGGPAHAAGHLALGDMPRRAWSVDIGVGSADDRRLLSPPVVAAGVVYTMDAEGQVSAFDAARGKRLWRVAAVPDDETENALGGGLAYDDGRLYVATGIGEVVALDARSGDEIWRSRIGMPIRSAPTVSEGRLFVVTTENQTFAIDTADGSQLWSHEGIADIAQLLGAAAPAAVKGLVVAAYSSGEIYLLRADSGRIVWRDGLAVGRRMSAVASLSDINGDPVIDRDRVYAISQSGQLAAIGLKSGTRLWEQDISGTQTPWVAGDYLFVLTSHGELLCLSRRSGGIRWVTQLPRYENPEDKEDPIFWSGPVLAGDRLVVVGSNEEAVAVSPYTGEVLGRLDLPGSVSLAPVVADKTLYVLTDDADLVALR